MQLDDSGLYDTTVSTRTLLNIELNKGNGKLGVTIDKSPLTLQGTAAALVLKDKDNNNKNNNNNIY